MEVSETISSFTDYINDVANVPFGWCLPMMSQRMLSLVMILKSRCYRKVLLLVHY